MPKLIAIGAASLTAGLVLVLALSSRTKTAVDAEPAAEASHASAIDDAPKPEAIEPQRVLDASTPITAGAPVERVAAARDEQARVATAQPAPAPEPVPAVIEAAETRVATAQPAPAPEPVPAVIEAAQVAAIAAPEAAAPAPQPSAVEEGAPSATIELGQVAYLRCDGLATKRGAFPCPRDRALEKSVREILATLDRCRVADALGRGRFEVRLKLTSAAGRPDLEVRAPTEAGERAVRACAGAALSRVTTVLRPERMIVSQRFTVR